jgi:hypothetical protein
MKVAHGLGMVGFGKLLVPQWVTLVAVVMMGLWDIVVVEELTGLLGTLAALVPAILDQLDITVAEEKAVLHLIVLLPVIRR